METYLEKLHRTGYKTVTRDNLTWYRLNSGGLEEVPQEQQGGTMPAYDLYVVIRWEPDSTSLRVVYWVEGKNSPSFQNVYTKEVSGVTPEEELTVSLTGSSPTISGTSGNLVEAGFKELMVQQYGSEQYAAFFSYSPQDTKTSPGNVSSAQETGTGGVADGAITGESFSVLQSISQRTALLQHQGEPKPAGKTRV